MALDLVFTNLLASSGSSIAALRYGFLLLFAAQISLRSNSQYPVDYLTRTTPTFKLYGYFTIPDNACYRSFYRSPVSFDFIIIGAGGAGSVIANRLSQNPNRRVLVIDAGGNPSNESIIPQFAPSGGSKNTFKYNAKVSSAYSNAFEFGCSNTFGKQLGGSPDAMMYVCGNDRDWNSWAAAGNPGWDYNSMLPLIKRSERNTDSTRNPAYHGFNGSVTVSNFGQSNPLIATLESAFNEIGYSSIPDINAQVYNGFARVQSTVKDGEKCGGYKAFLEPVKTRPNLFIMKNSLISNIIFSGNKATGVNVKTSEYLCPTIAMTATKEVILASGALASPKVLLQSGVGPAADMIKLGIRSIKNLPVGSNLQDHVVSIHFFEINLNSTAQTIEQVAEMAQEYYYNRTGGYAGGSLNGVGFINTLDASATYPDVQLLFTHFPKGQLDLRTTLASLGYKKNFVDDLVNINEISDLVMVYNVLLNPKSRGTYKLKDYFPGSSPVVNANYLSHSDDVNTLIRGANKITDLVYSSAMRQVEAGLLQLTIAECDLLEFGTDDYWKCYFKYFTQNLGNPAGTCKMGPVGDPTAVVDSKLRLQGFTNIRVADTSILPTITSGDAQCATYAIGQKAADIIMAAWP